MSHAQNILPWKLVQIVEAKKLQETEALAKMCLGEKTVSSIVPARIRSLKLVRELVRKYRASLPLEENEMQPGVIGQLLQLFVVAC